MAGPKLAEGRGVSPTPTEEASWPPSSSCRRWRQAQHHGHTQAIRPGGGNARGRGTPDPPGLKPATAAFFSLTPAGGRRSAPPHTHLARLFVCLVAVRPYSGRLAACPLASTLPPHKPAHPIWCRQQNPLKNTHFVKHPSVGLPRTCPDGDGPGAEEQPKHQPALGGGGRGHTEQRVVARGAPHRGGPLVLEPLRAVLRAGGQAGRGKGRASG